MTAPKSESAPRLDASCDALDISVFMHVVVAKPLRTFARHAFVFMHVVVAKPLRTFARHALAGFIPRKPP
ncbi:hypothetical protein [Mesorhizobium sanjuanii]|uniref:hypothetical protein n=1 Tax=Mesorhizobium sanjuanii TaxID=2037900 RepID=UPI001AD81756|nr:hypothetical protein [Mesorhizobium sanjuanii]